MTNLEKVDGMLHVDCNKLRCRITGQDGFEVTILDDLTSIVRENKAIVRTQALPATEGETACTKVSIYLS